MFLFLLATVSLVFVPSSAESECVNDWFCAYYDRSACTFAYFRVNCMRMCDTCPPNSVNALQKPPNSKWAKTFKRVHSESSMSQIRGAAGFQHIRGENGALKKLKGRFSDPNAYNAPVWFTVKEDPLQNELFVKPETLMSRIKDAAGYQHIRGENGALKVLKGRLSDPNGYNAPVRITVEEDPFQSELFVKPETSLSYIYVPLYVFLFISCFGLFVVWFSVRKRKHTYRLIAERIIGGSKSSPYGSV